MILEKFKLIKEYDCESDVLYFRIPEDYEHNKTIELAPLILMDFDKNGYPVSLELIGASEFMNIDKSLLENDFIFRMDVTIEKWAIIVNATFHFPVINEISLNEVGLNDCEILPKHAHFVSV